MGLSLVKKCFFLLFMLTAMLFAENAHINKRHILYLMQAGKCKAALSKYQDYCKERKKSDFQLLQQLAWQILERGASSSKEETQQLALFGAGQAMSVRSLDILSKGIFSSNAQNQVIAIHFLSFLQDDHIDELLVRAMSSQFLLTRLEAAYEMTKRRHKCALGQIESLMHRLPPFMKALFPQLIAAIGTPESTQFLKSLFHDNQIGVRIETILSVTQNERDDFLAQIRSRIKQPNVAEQEACCYALGKLKDSSSISLLQKMSHSSSENVRLACYLSLYGLGERSVKERIEKLAENGHLFAIYQLKNIDNSSETLFNLLSSNDEAIKLNAALALLEKKDDRCLDVIKKWLLSEGNDVAIRPIFSMGRSMKAWHYITSASVRKEDLPYPMEALVGIKQQILNKTRDLSEDAFCGFAELILKKKERSLIPTIVALLENLNSEKAISILEKYSDDNTSPLVRDYCHLALFRMRQEKDGGKYIENWLLHQSQHERIKLQPFLPWQSRIDLDHFSLSPEEKSRLLIEMFYAFAQRQDEKSIDILVEALKRGHENNRYVLAGLLLRSME